jgi:cell division septal protein FtsQ
MRLPFGDSPRFTLQSLRRQIWQWFSVVFLAAVVIVPLALLIWFIFFTPTFNIQAITIIDARPHTTTAVRELIKSKIGENIFFLNTEVLEQHIQTSISQIRNVHIVRKLPGTLKIIVQEKTPALLLLSRGKYYFVDSEGIAYEEAQLDTLPGTVLPIVKNNDQESQVTIGTPVVETSFVQFVQAIQDQLDDVTGAKVVETRIPSLAAREVHFRLDNNWEIRFDITRSPAAQLDILKRLLTSTITDQEKQTLQYIDLRIPNRVYYKTRGGAENQ